jgi:ribosomal protein L37AE/L43A
MQLLIRLVIPNNHQQSINLRGVHTMPQSKRLTKKQRQSMIKCPNCASRSFKQVEKLNILERVIYLGCKVWLCNKCGKKWAG